MRTLCVSALAALVLLLSAAGTARADRAFRPLPGASGLKMRTVAYDGSTNGRMIIEVKNTARTARRFEAAGLYFIPEGDPEKAPQRLGAAGPFQIATDRTDGKPGAALETLQIAAGQTVRLELHVFCIDSHRPSPTSQTPFRLAARRMPKALRQKIQAGTSTIVRKHSGKLAPAATGEIQSHVWKARDEKWIKLEGERRQEKAPAPVQRQSPRPQQLEHEQRRSR